MKIQTHLDYFCFIQIRTGNKVNITVTDLATLGQCFGPTIPIDQFDSLTPSDFRSSSSYFQGISFQPNQNWITKISTKIQYLKKLLSYQKIKESVLFLVNNQNFDFNFNNQFRSSDKRSWRNNHILFETVRCFIKSSSILLSCFYSIFY